MYHNESGTATQDQSCHVAGNVQVAGAEPAWSGQTTGGAGGGRHGPGAGSFKEDPGEANAGPYDWLIGLTVVYDEREIAWDDDGEGEEIERTSFGTVIAIEEPYAVVDRYSSNAGMDMPLLEDLRGEDGRWLVPQDAANPEDGERPRGAAVGPFDWLIGKSFWYPGEVEIDGETCLQYCEATVLKIDGSEVVARRTSPDDGFVRRPVRSLCDEDSPLWLGSGNVSDVRDRSRQPEEPDLGGPDEPNQGGSDDLDETLTGAGTVNQGGSGDGTGPVSINGQPAHAAGSTPVNNYLTASGHNGPAGGSEAGSEATYAPPPPEPNGPAEQAPQEPPAPETAPRAAVDESAVEASPTGAGGVTPPAETTIAERVFCNYETVEEEGEDGETRKRKVPLRMEEIRQRLGRLRPGWPKRVGEGQLFIYATQHKAIYLDSPARLFAWIDYYAQVNWMNGPQYISPARFYEYLTMVAERYDAIETLPHWPPVPGVYYMHPPVGEPAGLLDELIEFFSASRIDKQLIKALILTVFWGGSPGKRPAFLVEGPEDDPDRGRGVGKTSFLDIIAQELADGSVNVSPRETMADIKTRLLTSDEGRRRLIRLDNVKTHKLSWDELENEITSPVISGKALYRGEGRRPNLCIWAITLNVASLSKDMALRVISIRLDRPAYQADWEGSVRRFIRENRQGLLGDIRRILEAEPGTLTPESRWAEWEVAILSKLQDAKALQAEILRRQRAMDTDEEESDIFREMIITKLVLYNYEPASQAILIPTKVLAEWVNEVAPRKLAANQASAFIATLGIKNLKKSDRDGQRMWLWTGDEHDGKEKAVKLGDYDQPASDSTGSGGSDQAAYGTFMDMFRNSSQVGVQCPTTLPGRWETWG